MSQTSCPQQDEVHAIHPVQSSLTEGNIQEANKKPTTSFHKLSHSLAHFPPGTIHLIRRSNPLPDLPQTAFTPPPTYLEDVNAEPIDILLWPILSQLMASCSAVESEGLRRTTVDKMVG